MREWENPPFAPIALVEPTKLVVRAAMSKVRKGRVDIVLERQRVVLQNTESGKLYRVTDGQVRQTPKGVESKGNLDSGLFVNVINLDKAGLPISWGLSIQIPRITDKVNPESICLLITIPPETMDLLATELTKAKIVPEKRYRKACDQLRLKGESPWMRGRR